ncbi:MAG: hypothetical protein ABI183_25125 [Polyangiaceae bacterium]
MLRAVALLFALGLLLHLTRAIRTTPAPAALSVASPLYGISDEKRQRIFQDLAADEPRARTESAKKFPGEPWSIEDERAAHERDRAREIAGNYKISVTQAYLILDEAIREHRLYMGKPLEGNVVPLKPRYR